MVRNISVGICFLSKNERNTLRPKVKRWGVPGVLGIWGEWLYICRELGSTGNYFQGFGEQVHSFGDLGSPYKKAKKLTLKEKPSFH